MSEHVKQAEIYDIPDIIEIMGRIEAQSIYKFPIVLNLKHMAHTLEQILSPMNPQRAACFYTDNAIIAGQITSCIYNFNAKIANEMCLQSNGKDGDIVLSVYEKWARDSGATHIAISSLESLPKKNVSRRKMAMLGYKPEFMMMTKRLI